MMHEGILHLFAVGALEHLERHAEVHDLAGFQAHVVPQTISDTA